MNKPTALVAGVGAEQGIGAAVCRRFAAEGYHVLAAGRTEAKLDAVADTVRKAGGSIKTLVVDLTQEAAVIDLFDQAMAPGAGLEPASVVVFNAGDNRMIDFREVEAALFEAFWRVGCFAGFLVGREAARRLVPLGRGTVIFTGASGSLRGKPGFAQFAAAKAGLRMVAQSMAREYGPMGLHVAHAIIDGGVAGARLLNAAPRLAEIRGDDGLPDGDAIAEAYWQIHRQPRSAWSQEIELRPFKETF